MEYKSGTVTERKDVVYPETIKFHEGNWWQRRSKLEKRLVAFAALVLLIAIILLIVLIVLQVQRDKSKERLQQTTPSVPKQPDFCMTPSCVQTAARIVDRANFSADPCEDFYEYACGSWMKKAVIADDQVENNIFTNLGDKLSTNLRKLLEALPKDGEAASIQKARDIYKSCLDLDRIEARGHSPLLNTLSELGGWPVLNSNWSASSFKLQSSLTRLASYNQYPLILMGLEFEPQNTSKYIVVFDQPALGIPSRDYYLRERNDTTLMAYQTFITNVAVALGANPVSAATNAEEIVDFEIQLANITVPAVERIDPSKLYSSVVAVREMAQKYPEFDWLDYLQGIMSADGIGIDITAEEVIINKAPAYFEKLFQLLGNTESRVQANYLMWIFAKGRLGQLGSKFRNIVLEYGKVLLGNSEEPPRWKTCSETANGAMPLAVGRLFVDAHFDEVAKSTMLELISNLREAFNELIDEADWMDDVTRAVAQEKAAVIGEKIGYPDALKNNSYLDDLYKVLDFNSTLYYENIIEWLQEGVKENFRLLRDPVDKERWLKNPALVGAFYNPYWNEIIFPAGILQKPFFDETQPRSINFGSIGSFIGHEITHGFDSGGRQYDKNGGLRQWWENDVIQRFYDRVKCFIAQTSTFYWPEAGAKVNGLLTQKEDIADNGGMKESFRGYRKWVAKQGKEEPLLPGISLDNNQLFFLGWTQAWCTTLTPQAARLYLISDTHSPNRIRAFSPMRNMPEFAQAYNCPEGSHMNPVKKCSVW